MNYKQYLKQPINESLNSAKAKFSGSPEEFEVLKNLDPTANKKWKYMDFIVKAGNQPDLKDLLTEFERLANKGIIKNKDINSYDYNSLKKEIDSSSKVTTKRQVKIDVKKDVIKVNENPLVIVPLTEDASIQYGKGTKWCTAATNNNYFDSYFFINPRTLFYIIADKKWAVSLWIDGICECFNEEDEQINISEIEENTGIGLDDIIKWNSQIKSKVQSIREKNLLTLFVYIEDDNVDGLKKLIQAGADVDTVNEFGQTLLCFASLRGRSEIIKFLIEAGADVDKPDKDGETPVYKTSIGGYVSDISFLIKANADINIANNQGKTPLINAIIKDYYSFVKNLILVKVDVEKSDNQGRTPLFWAKKGKNLQIVELLKQAGATK